jgi:hypothetical protein
VFLFIHQFFSCKKFEAKIMIFKKNVLVIARCQGKNK